MVQSSSSNSKSFSKKSAKTAIPAARPCRETLKLLLCCHSETKNVNVTVTEKIRWGERKGNCNWRRLRVGLFLGFRVMFRFKSFSEFPKTMFEQVDVIWVSLPVTFSLTTQTKIHRSEVFLHFGLARTQDETPNIARFFSVAQPVGNSGSVFC